MWIKEGFSALAILLTLAGFVPYIHSIVQGQVRPHVFSWIIWGITTLVVFFAQVQDHAGVGAWPIGISATITFIVAWLAYLKKGDSSITRSDWGFLLLALSSLPLWYLAADPLWAVVVLTIADLLGFGPTLRQAYRFPHNESLLFFSIFTSRNCLVIAALENYSLTTVLFPAMIAAACVLLMGVVVIRRRQVSS